MGSAADRLRNGVVKMDGIGFVVALVIVTAIASAGVTNTLWKISAVNNGVAEYCDNMAWAWEGGCK